jgi:Tfp pilus assembly protein PilF
LGHAWSGLGKIAFSQFDFTTAEQHLLEAVKHMANHIGTWHLLAWVYILQNAPGKARTALEKAYEIDRNFGDTHGGLAVVDVMENHDDEARVRIRKAKRLMPEGTSALYAEWLLLLKADDAADAKALFAATLDQLQPNSQDSRRTLVERKLYELIAARTNAGQAPH